MGGGVNGCVTSLSVAFHGGGGGRGEEANINILVFSEKIHELKIHVFFHYAENQDIFIERGFQEAKRFWIFLMVVMAL
jgi:hypothetical protein